MATTGIWKAEKRLDRVIDYVINPEKTTKDSIYKELHNIDDYNNINYETEEDCFVSALNCSTHRAYKDMMLTKELYGKQNGILAYHSFQSFKEGEVSPTQAHLIGVKLAEELWGDRFEVIVSTHINTNHIHNHFVINSVSFKDGKKYHDSRESYALLRQTSDAICSEYGLSVVENKKVNKVNYDNYYKKHITTNNYYIFAKKDLDRAIAMAVSYKDFENIMIKMGYELIERSGKLSIKRSPYKRNIRIERAFGSEYSIKSINTRIENTYSPRVPFIEAYNPEFLKEEKEYKKNKAHGIYGLYKYYCYILKVYPVKYPRKILPPSIRLDIEKMEEISEQTKLLVREKIETNEQLLFYKDKLNTEVQTLVGKKHNLWIKHKRVKTDDEKSAIFNEINKITEQLKVKRKEVVLCEKIEKRTKDIEENIKELEENKRKEKEI